MYLEEPAPFVAALAELADDDGVVSIAAKDEQPISHPSTAKTTPSPSS
jgi:hypothetical protein